MNPSTSRRALLGGLLLLPTASVLVACSAPSGPETEALPAATAANGTFPATVEHALGSTTVEKAPTRVVSIGLTEQDTLLQLGVVPVATTEWYGEQPSAVWPWAQPLLGGAEPQVLSTANGFEFEKIAALKPDLIIGVNAGIKEKDYQLLTAIAPTVAHPKGGPGYFGGWREQVQLIAGALGRAADGDALISRTEQAYRDAAAAHPDWKGRTATFSQGGPYEGELYVYPDGLNTDFLTDLGFAITPGLEKYASEEGSQAVISAERVDLLEADVVVFATEDQKMLDELLDFSTVRTLPAVAERRAVYTDATLAGAIYFLTPLSASYLLERLVPLLERAVAGNAPTQIPTP